VSDRLGHGGGYVVIEWAPRAEPKGIEIWTKENNDEAVWRGKQKHSGEKRPKKDSSCPKKRYGQTMGRLEGCIPYGNGEGNDTKKGEKFHP